ncbi:MAG: hypothetical protein WCE21_05515 [Candidatus Babeliales bacterium]
MHKHQSIAAVLFLCINFVASVFAAEISLECDENTSVILPQKDARKFKIIKNCIDDLEQENGVGSITPDASGRISFSFPHIRASTVLLLDQFIQTPSTVTPYEFHSLEDIYDCLNTAEQLEAPRHIRDALKKRFLIGCANAPVSKENEYIVPRLNGINTIADRLKKLYTLYPTENESPTIRLSGKNITLDTAKRLSALFLKTPTHDLISQIPTYKVDDLQHLQHAFYIAKSVGVAPEILSGLAYRLRKEYGSYYDHPSNKEETEKISSHLLPHITNQSGKIMQHGTKYTRGKSMPCYILYLDNHETLQVLDGIEKRVSPDSAHSIIGVHMGGTRLKYAEIARFKKVFPNLEHIYFFRNQITHLSSSDVAAMEGIKVALNDNKITSIEPYLRYNPFRSSYTHIYLENNPLTPQAKENIKNSFNKGMNLESLERANFAYSVPLTVTVSSIATYIIYHSTKLILNSEKYPITHFLTTIAIGTPSVALTLACLLNRSHPPITFDKTQEKS